jgi:hypothetical protein
LIYDTVLYNSNFLVDILSFSYSVFAESYIAVSKNKTIPVFVPTLYIEDLVKLAAKRATEGHEIYFGPALRKKNINQNSSGCRNIYLAGCFWVEILSSIKGLTFEQRQNEADNLLSDFRKYLQIYDVGPSYIVSYGAGYTVYFSSGNPFFNKFSEWKKIQKALTKIAKGERPAAITDFVRMPGTLNFEDRDNPKKVEIIYQGYCLPPPEIKCDFEIEDKFDDWYHDELIYEAVNLHKDQVSQVFKKIAQEYR